MLENVKMLNEKINERRGWNQAWSDTQELFLDVDQNCV